MNCSSDSLRGESDCRTSFSVCSDQISEEEDQVKGLPSVPGLELQELSQSQPGFLSCLLLLYNCSSSQAECKQEFRQCAQQYPLEETVEQTGPSHNQQPHTNTGRRDEVSGGAGTESDEVLGGEGTRSDEVPRVAGPGDKVVGGGVGRPPDVNSSPDIFTPSLAGGSGKIPESK